MVYVERGLTAISRIPHLHGTIIASRSNMQAIGGPGYCIHGVEMACVERGLTTINEIPHLSGVIIASRGDTPTIGRPGHGIDTSGMASEERKTCSSSRWRRHSQWGRSHACRIPWYWKHFLVLRFHSLLNTWGR